MGDKDTLLMKFEGIYGDAIGARVFFAPREVNLIGEYMDGNGGHVLTCALALGTYAVARRRQDRKLRFYSVNYSEGGISESSLDDLGSAEEDGWLDCLKGVIWAFEKKGYKVLCGMDILLSGNIPDGLGQSSCVSIKMVAGTLLNAFFNFGISSQELAMIGQDVENRFKGDNSGGMNPFAAAIEKKGCGVFLDTTDLSYEYVPLKLEGAKIIIASSSKRRGMGRSEYDERREECEMALSEIQSGMGINTLGDLNEELFGQIKMAIHDEDRRKRAKYIVYENQRVIKAVQALKNNDIAQFGRLINESHCSLRDDYEVTEEELDILVEEAWKVDGVIASRMAETEFGGYTMSIVKGDRVDEFVKRVGQACKERIGCSVEFYVTEVGFGPCEL